MAKLLKLRRGTTTQHGGFTGAEGEVTVDLNKDTLVVHDGTTLSGHTLLREDLSNLPAGQIDNADINTSAAIAGTKIAPDFGSQNITTTGTINGKDLNLSDTTPKIQLTDSNSDSDFSVELDGGLFQIRDTTNDAYRIKVASDGTVDIGQNLNANGGVDVTGDITVTGTVDGADVGAMNTTLATLSSVNGSLANGVTATTQTQSDNSTKVATTAYVRSAVANVVDSAPAALDTLNELAAALGDDANYATTTATSIGEKLPKSGGQMTGNITFSGSQTVDGRDLSADGAKLDGIQAGATDDQTANEILTAIKTVDGSGSGLDADTLDGVQAGGFLRADTADTATADISFSGGAGAVTVNGGSDIRITGGSWTGDFTSGIKIQANASDSYFQYHGNLYFRDTGGSGELTLDQSGNLTAAGNVTAYSDRTLKTHINTINDALGICGQLRGVSYKWAKNGTDSIGVIAQEVEEVLPSIVVTNKYVDPNTGDETEIKSVDYGKIVSVLINAINELKAEVDTLKGGS